MRTAVVDFDNTIAGYDKWRGTEIFGPPVPYALDALWELYTWGWNIVVFTTRGDAEGVYQWLMTQGFPVSIRVNDSSHNPPGCSHKPIAEVYFDDRDAHCVGTIPYNWHRAVRRVRRKYLPRPVNTFVDDSRLWAAWPNSIAAFFVRRYFRKNISKWMDEIQQEYTRGCERLKGQNHSDG